MCRDMKHEDKTAHWPTYGWSEVVRWQKGIYLKLYNLRGVEPHAEK